MLEAELAPGDKGNNRGIKKMKQITPVEVEKLLAEGKELNIIDVRERYEMAQGKIPGSVNIPINELNAHVNELDKGKEYIIVCLTGSRSMYATMILERMGFDATNMNGGLVAWQGQIA